MNSLWRDRFMPECAANLGRLYYQRQPTFQSKAAKWRIRIGVAFMVLMFVNVGIGLYFIFWHESKNPNRPLLEAQMREQIAKSIEQAATLTPAPNALGVSEITIPAETGKLDAVADKVIAIVSELGGSATKGVPDAGRLSILVDLPASRESEFRGAVASIQGGGSAESRAPAKPPEPGSPTPATDEKKSFIVQIVESEERIDGFARHSVILSEAKLQEASQAHDYFDYVYDQ